MKAFKISSGCQGIHGTEVIFVIIRLDDKTRAGHPHPQDHGSPKLKLFYRCVHLRVLAQLNLINHNLREKMKIIMRIKTLNSRFCL